MKLSLDDKKKIYKMHLAGYGYVQISRRFHVNSNVINYLCRLIDRHGLGILIRGYTSYPKTVKLKAIKRVLENNESIWSVAVDIGLPNKSELQQWIKSYIENGYNVVTKKKGRPSTRDKEKEDSRRAGEGERTPSRAAVEEDHRSRILKKIVCLNSRGRKEEKEQLTEAVTELRQELKCSLDFILETINSNDSLPSLPRSDYYY